jgi:hypothetical protein
MSRQYFTTFFLKYVPVANSLEDKHSVEIKVFIILFTFSLLLKPKDSLAKRVFN